VKVIVGFAPGGPTDLVARLVAQKLTEATGKNFFVENVAGAGGNVGTIRAAKSSPDGYTLLVTGGNITNNQYLFAAPGYDPLKDFDAVTLAAATPVVLAVNPSVPATSVKELVAWIRANPGKESYASPGAGTPPQLVGALFQHALQLDLVNVPFDGGGPAVQATVGGHTPISFGAMAPADQSWSAASAGGDGEGAYPRHCRESRPWLGEGFRGLGAKLGLPCYPPPARPKTLLRGCTTSSSRASRSPT